MVKLARSSVTARAEKAEQNIRRLYRSLGGQGAIAEKLMYKPTGSYPEKETARGSNETR